MIKTQLCSTSMISVIQEFVNPFFFYKLKQNDLSFKPLLTRFISKETHNRLILKIRLNYSRYLSLIFCLDKGTDSKLSNC